MFETKLLLPGIENLAPSAHYKVKVPYDGDNQAVVVGMIKSSTLPDWITMRPFLIDISEGAISAGLTDSQPLQVVPFIRNYSGEKPHRAAFADNTSNFAIHRPTLGEIEAVARHDADVDDIRTLGRFSSVVVDVALRKQAQYVR